MTYLFGEYMTPLEFADLDSDAHHAVWRAHAEGRIDAIPANKSSSACTRLYNRAQVLRLLRELEVASGG